MAELLPTYKSPSNGSYQIDAWGRIRRTVESFRDQAQASAADLATVSLSMHAQLALFYFQARSLDAQEQLLNSTVTQYQEALDLIENRFAGGLASDLEFSRPKRNSRQRKPRPSMLELPARSSSTPLQF